MEAWGPIVPWLEHLRGRLRVEETEAPHSARRTYAWLQLALPKRRRSTSSEQVREIREALELLAIVAAADVGTWRHLLRETCGVQIEADDVAESECSPLRVIFVLDDHTKESILWPAALCNKFFGLLTPVVHDEAFLAIKHFALEQMNAIRREKARHRGMRSVNVAVALRIPFCLHFAPKRMGHTSLAQYLNSVHKVVMDVQEKQASPRQGDPNGKTAIESGSIITALENNNGEAVPNNRSGASHVHPFVLDAIQINLGEFELNEASTRTVEAIIATGVSVSCLQLSLCASDFLADDECPRQPLASCYQSIVARGSKALLADSEDFVGGSPELPSSEPQCPVQGGVETLVVHGRDIDDRRFAALCSSLAEAQSVSDLVLEAVFAQDSMSARVVKWKWLAFALASELSTSLAPSSLRRLTISDTLLLEADVDAMEAVFTSDYPAMELVDPLWSHDDQQALSVTKGPNFVPFVCLEKGAIIYTEPVLYPEDWMHNTVVVQHDASFAVMANDPKSEWIEVLVPGYGKCWVHEDAAKSTKRQHTNVLSANQDGRGEEPRTRITSFAIAVDVESDSVLMRLFDLVGESLEDVCLNVNTLQDQALDAILASCPRVKRLVLRGAQLRSLDVLLRAYHERDFQLSSLTLTDFQIDTYRMLEFVRRLSYPGDARSMARNLKELCIGQMMLTAGEKSEDAGKGATRTILDSLLAMLDANRSALEFFELHLSPSLFDEFATQFQSRSNVPLVHNDPRRPRLVSPSLSCRLALLSVLKSREKGELLSAHAALRLVFAFASTPVRRHVRVLECE